VEVRIPQYVVDALRDYVRKEEDRLLTEQGAILRKEEHSLPLTSLSMGYRRIGQLEAFIWAAEKQKENNNG
jgi:hypothetical protein